MKTLASATESIIQKDDGTFMLRVVGTAFGITAPALDLPLDPLAAIAKAHELLNPVKK